MTSKYKNKHRAPRKGKMGPLLDRLKSGEAATVLRRLLKAHPDLSSEADGIARSLLHQVEYEEVAAEIEDEIRALDYEDLNARAGSHEWGCVEPSEAAWEILEETVEPVLDDMKRHIELGLEAGAKKRKIQDCYSCYFFGDFDVHRRDWRALLRRKRLLRVVRKRQNIQALRIKWQKTRELQNLEESNPPSPPDLLIPVVTIGSVVCRRCRRVEWFDVGQTRDCRG